MSVTRTLVRALALAALVSPLGAAPAAAVGADDFRALAPGEFVTRTQRIPVRVVFIGYRAGAVDDGALRAALPPAYQPVVRYPQFYGLDGRNLGLRYEFDYELIHKDAAFEQRFFARLAALGKPGPRTSFQQDYNDQRFNALDVSPTVLSIDAASVQRYLSKVDPAPAASYTLYFINWYGRGDFQFHVYTRTQARDPDTGARFGRDDDSRKLIAWGGGQTRSWFYDLSAGPEFRSANWSVDERSQGIIPPVWEYGTDGSRGGGELTADLARVTRYVAINLLLTPSPLYDPLASAPGRRGGKVAHMALFRNPLVEDRAGFKPSLVRARLRRLQPHYRWRLGLRVFDPIGDDTQRSLEIFTGARSESDCWAEFQTIEAQLYCHFSSGLDQYVPPYSPDDYVSAAFAFDTTDESLGESGGLLGTADDNYVDGTPSFTYLFTTPGTREAGYGLTLTAVHEWGHHMGLSHPHDGYDSERALDYSADEDLYRFVWAGDESHTVMSYLDLAPEFGRFEQDNLWRWETAGYLNWSNALLAALLEHPQRERVSGLMLRAESVAARAVTEFERWNYLRAAHQARGAYLLLQLAAARIGARSQALGLAFTPLPEGMARRHDCTLAGHRGSTPQ